MFLKHLVFAAMFLAGIGANFLYAHCDSLSGPVILDARKALEKGDVTPVLKWTQSSDEPEVRATFEKTMAVRKLNPDAQELADRFFFETLVRLHREGEGAPFTGLKPAGTVDPILQTVDQAIASGNGEGLINTTKEKVIHDLEEEFSEVVEKRKTADRSVEDGRAYVRAYVHFLHHVEGIYQSETEPPKEHEH